MWLQQQLQPAAPGREKTKEQKARRESSIPAVRRAATRCAPHRTSLLRKLTQHGELGQLPAPSSALVVSGRRQRFACLARVGDGQDVWDELKLPCRTEARRSACHVAPERGEQTWKEL